MEKTVDQSRVETYHIIRPSDLNSEGRLYGGTLVAWIDEVAVLVARKHTQMSVTTGSIDNLRFLRGAYLKDTIVLLGCVAYVGNTSIVVKVETYVEHISGERDLINVAYLTLIGLDEQERPARVPRLKLQTTEEQTLWNHIHESHTTT